MMAVIKMMTKIMMTMTKLWFDDNGDCDDDDDYDDDEKKKTLTMIR